MSDDLDRRLHAADPIEPATLPSAADTNEALARLSALRARRSRRVKLSRPTWVLGTTSALAATAVVLVLLFTAAATPTPSYAVTRHKNGTVTVRLATPLAVAALNRHLQLMGVPARITLAQDAAALAASRCGVGAAASIRTFSFNPKAIPPGRVLVLTGDQRLRFLYARAVAMKMAQVVHGNVAVRLSKLTMLHMSRAGLGSPLLKTIDLVRARLLRLGFLDRPNVAVKLPKLLMLRMMTLQGRMTARPLAFTYAQGLPSPSLARAPRTIRLICAARAVEQARH
jgi:hypothetical protein